RDLEPGKVRRPFGRGIDATPLGEIGAVDPCGGNCDLDFARPRFGHRAFDALEDFGAAFAGDFDGTHFLPDLDGAPMPVRLFGRYDGRGEMSVVDGIGKVLVFEAKPGESGI